MKTKTLDAFLVLAVIVFSVSYASYKFEWFDKMFKKPPRRSSSGTQEFMARMDSVRKLEKPVTKPKIVRMRDDFWEAIPGEIWRIYTEDTFVLSKPEWPRNKYALRRRIVTVIGSGEKVEIVEQKSGLWKEVIVYGHGDRPYARGWVLGQLVEEAAEVQ